MIPIVFRKLQPGEKPQRGELWARAANEEDRGKRALAQLVWERGVNVLQGDTKTTTKIVVDASGVQPTFDEMLAACFAQRKLNRQSLPATFKDLAI